MCVFNRETFLKFYNKLYLFILFQVVLLNSTGLLIIMSPSGQKRGSCGHGLCSTTTRNVPDVVRRGWETIPVLRNLIARYITRLRLLKYNNWPPRPTGAGKIVESRRNLKVPVTRPPTLVDPSEGTLLVSTDKPPSVESTPKKKKRSDGSPKSSKRRHSSKPTSDDLKSLDDKWNERFSRLEVLLLDKSFAVPVRPVNLSAVVTREHPFFDPGSSSSVMSTGLVTEGTGSSLVQTTSEAAQSTATQPPLGVPVRDVSKSATRPVQGPGTSDVATQPLQVHSAEIATQPLQAPAAGTTTQPTQAPGAGPEVLPTSIDSTQLNQSLSGVRLDEFAGESESEAEMDGESASPTSPG